MAFGEIPGVLPQTQFDAYKGLVETQIHRQYNAGMVGGKAGTESVVLNGGYDDQDFGDEVIYTGFGGRDSSGHQVADQE
jgi:putative restriction endonuclease